MSVIIDGSVAAVWQSGTIGGHVSPIQETTTPRQGRGTSLNAASGISVIDPFISIGTKSVISADQRAKAIVPFVDDHQWSDFHLRMWFIPPNLILTNPPLDTDIAFTIWNTWTDTETIASIVVVGSSVLTFALIPTDTLHDAELRTTSFQIGPGEADIDAQVTFTTESMSGVLSIVAAVSATFSLIPSVPVTERWRFLTDVITTYDGAEQRIALRSYPRIDQEFKVQALDLDERREQFKILKRNITVQSLIPLYQYAVNVDGDTIIGGTKVFFDPIRTNMRAGDFIAIVNTITAEVVLSTIASVDADGATMTAVSSANISAPSWVAMPVLTCTIKDGAGINMSQITGDLSIKANSFQEPTLLRPNATRVPATFDGLPFLDRRPMVTAAENFEYARDIIDNDTGARDLNSSHLHAKMSGNRRFIIQRSNDPEEMDYWRSFFDTIRGAQGSFFFSTYFPDLTLVESQLPLTQAASQILVNEGTFNAEFGQFGTWDHLEFQYNNDPNQRSQHTLTSQTTNLDGTTLLGFTPTLPDDPNYIDVTQISFLQRCRARDTVALRHFANYSEISFAITTTDE